MITKLIEYAKRYDMLPSSGAVLACVSGGADSMALLTALLELAPTFGFVVEAAHFDHKLRGEEADRDREFVTEYCEKRSIPCHVGSGDTRAYAKEHKLGIEEAARELRYAFFHELADKMTDNDISATDNADLRRDLYSEAAQITGCNAYRIAVRIATAHNSNDNAETVLLSLARGAGSRGLSGIPPVRGDIIRPLLCVTREEIEAFLLEREIPYIVDSTNKSDEYARNRIRHHVSPVIQSVNTLYLQHVLEAGELLRRDDEYLTSLAAEFLDIHGNDIPVSQINALPEAISARVVLLSAGGSLSFSHTSKVLDMCHSEHGSKIIETPHGVFIRDYDRLSFCEAHSADTFAPVEISPDTDVLIPELGLKISCRTVDSSAFSDSFYEMCQKNCSTINKSFIYFLFKKEQICGRIIVRPRSEGECISILGRNVSKSLKKLFIESKIPKRERERIPVIADDNGPLAVYGICTGARALPENGEPAIEISFTRFVDG